MTAPAARAAEAPSHAGYHYTSPIVRCPFKHALRHKFPWIEDHTARGAASETTDTPLSIGTLLHIAMETYYRTRCTSGKDNGEADLQAVHGAVEAAEPEAIARASNEAQTIDGIADVHRIIDRYHSFWGPDGKNEFATGDFVVVCDANGEPWLEREFELQTGDGTPYTAKIDFVAWSRGLLVAGDHKSANRGLGRYRQSGFLDGQFIGEYIQLREALRLQDPDLYVQGTMVNILAKNLAARTRAAEPFGRAVFSYDDALCLVYLQAVDEARRREAEYDARYAELLAAGVEPWPAFGAAYPRLGLLTGECDSYMRLCPFAEACRDPYRGETHIRHAFVPATKENPTP